MTAEGLCAAPTEPSKSLDIDVGHYMSLQTQREKDQYFIDLNRRRSKGYEYEKLP